MLNFFTRKCIQKAGCKSFENLTRNWPHVSNFIEFQETLLFFENHYSHIFYIVYDAFVAAELSLRQKGPHKAQREELEAVLYLLEKVRQRS